VLYQLSRPVKAAKDKSVLWDILQVLMTNRSLIFGPGNVDEEFVGCLTYCLVQFTDNVTNIRYNVRVYSVRFKVKVRDRMWDSVRVRARRRVRL
jgi:hypothetical protein